MKVDSSSPDSGGVERSPLPERPGNAQLHVVDWFGLTESNVPSASKDVPAPDAPAPAVAPPARALP